MHAGDIVEDRSAVDNMGAVDTDVEGMQNEDVALERQQDEERRVYLQHP
jgi:hypothetical protein